MLYAMPVYSLPTTICCIGRPCSRSGAIDMNTVNKKLTRLFISTLFLVISAPVGAGGHDQRAVEKAKIKLTLIRNVRVWEGNDDELTAAQNVLVENNLIKTLNADDSVDGADVIDGGGRIMIPGIIEAHGHLALSTPPAELGDTDLGYMGAVSVKAAEIYLMRGWTTVRDIGGPSQGLAKAIDDGVVPGPRIYPSAMIISQTSGHGDMRRLNDPHPNMGGSATIMDRFKLLADGPAEVRRAVRESLRMGATQIKVMAGGGISSKYDPIDTVQYSVEEMRAAVEAAADWDTYVAVHAYTNEAVNRALDAGVKVIEHGHLLSRETLKRVKKEGAYLSSQSFGFIRRFIQPGQTGGAGGKAAQVMEGVDRLMETARDIDLPVAFGTDTFGSLRAYRAGQTEFGFRKRWFDSPEILIQATRHNAELLELTGLRNPYPDGALGVIAEGAYADLLLVEGNPLENVALLEDYENNIKLIMKDGKVYKNTL